MTHKKIIFWGAKGHAKVLHEFIDKLGFSLYAIFDNNPTVLSPFDDIPIYYGKSGFLKWLNTINNQQIFCLVAIGGSKGKDRIEIQDFLRINKVMPIVAIHPTAVVASNSTISDGCQILANATIGVQVKLGKSCIINTSATVDHEVVLGDGVHVAPGATLAGCISVGNYSLIGVGSAVLPNVIIGNNVIIGAGSVVSKNIPDNVVAYGNPAKIQYKRFLEEE